MRLLKEKLLKMPKTFVDKMLVPWVKENYQDVAQLSIIYVRKPQIQKKDNVIIAREDIKNNLSYNDFQDFVMSFFSFLN